MYFIFPLILALMAMLAAMLYSMFTNNGLQQRTLQQLRGEPMNAQPELDNLPAKVMGTSFLVALISFIGFICSPGDNDSKPTLATPTNTQLTPALAAPNNPQDSSQVKPSKTLNLTSKKEPSKTAKAPKKKHIGNRGRTSRYITGPRGGCYYINANGNKVYVDHSYCN